MQIKFVVKCLDPKTISWKVYDLKPIFKFKHMPKSRFSTTVK